MKSFLGPVDGRGRTGQANATLVRTGGFYAYPLFNTVNTNAPSTNTLFALPIWIPRDCTIDRISTEVTTGGAAGAVTRVGLYATLTADDAPGALLYGSATIASTGTGTIEATSVATHVRAGLYFVAAVCQTNAPTYRSINSTVVRIPTSTFGGTGNPAAYTQSSVSGALPDPFGTPGTPSASPPLIGLYIA